MKIQYVFRTLAFLVLVLVSLAATQPAFATSPGTHHQIIVDQTGSFTLPVTDPGNPCNIPITYVSTGYIRANYWTDELGRWTKEVDIFGTFKQDLVGSNGNVINIQLQGPILFDVVYGILGENTAQVTQDTVGATAIMTVPHYGIVNGGGGQGVWIGNFDTSDPNNWVLISEQFVRQTGNVSYDHWDIVCGYLGGALK